MVYLYYISRLRYTILIGHPRILNSLQKRESGGKKGLGGGGGGGRDWEDRAGVSARGLTSWRYEKCFPETKLLTQEIGVARLGLKSQCYLTDSQHTDTRPTSLSTGPIKSDLLSLQMENSTLTSKKRKIYIQMRRVFPKLGFMHYSI